MVNNSFILSPIRLIFSDQMENFAALIIVWRLSVWHAPINSYKQLKIKGVGLEQLNFLLLMIESSNE